MPWYGIKNLQRIGKLDSARPERGFIGRSVATTMQDLQRESKENTK